MRHALQAAFLLAWTWTAYGAEPLQIPTGEQMDEVGKSAYATEQRARTRPIRFEQRCPPGEVGDVFQSSFWNTAEIGLSFPLTVNSGEAQLYSRYTCPNPGVKDGR